jgi:beta-glucanase (GH16 family)
MRAKLPTAQGLWPAFWLRADHTPGEIDIMESVGGMHGFTAQSVHQSTLGGRGKSAHDDRLPNGQSTAGWHTYSLLLESDAITWFIDGRQAFRVTVAQQPWLRQSFDHRMNIRLNLQVDGTMPAYYHHPVSDQTHFPAKYVVDWVRVYQFG